MMKPRIYVPSYGRIKKLGCLVGTATERFPRTARGAIARDATGMRGAVAAEPGTVNPAAQGSLQIRLQRWKNK